MATTACDHDYKEIASERVVERWQDKSIDDDDLSRSEIIDRMNGESKRLVTYRCNLCGDECQHEEI